MLTTHSHPHFATFLAFVKISFTASGPGAMKGSTLYFIQCFCSNCAALSKRKLQNWNLEENVSNSFFFHGCEAMGDEDKKSDENQ